MVLIGSFTTTLPFFSFRNGPHWLFHDHFALFFFPKWSSSALSRPLCLFFLSEMVLIGLITTTLSFFSFRNGPHRLFHDHFALFFFSKWSSSVLSRPLCPFFLFEMVLIGSITTTSTLISFKVGRHKRRFHHLKLKKRDLHYYNGPLANLRIYFHHTVMLLYNLLHN